MFGRRRHLRIKLKQFFQPLGVVLETATDVDALQHFVVALVGVTQVVRHGLRVVQVGDRGGEVRFAGQQDVFGAGSQVGFVLLGEQGDGEGVPAEGVGVAIVCFYFSADRSHPQQMDTRHKHGQIPELDII